MLDVGKFEKGNKEGLSRSVALLILKRPFVAVPVTKPTSHCLQLRMAVRGGRSSGGKALFVQQILAAHRPQHEINRHHLSLERILLGLELSLGGLRLRGLTNQRFTAFTPFFLPEFAGLVRNLPVTGLRSATIHSSTPQNGRAT